MQSVRFGEVQAYRNIAIAEVSAGRSIPELLVVNRGNTPVLLIDGEELSGAKKNRVLNTSILLKESSKTRIPVSCTERGRWPYTSRAFQESDNFMALIPRTRKTRSVSGSLAASASFLAD